MDIQIEHLENQIARMTVGIEADRLEQAKQKAAKVLSSRVRIPGFRKGKVPYRILVQNGLEPEILNEAIDHLAQEVYREMIEQADVEPYGPGSFEDFQLEPPTFIYTVPLQPKVDLKNYRDVRLDFEAPEVNDEEVDRAMKSLQQREALVEESQSPAKIGNRVRVDIHSEFVDDAPEAEGEEADAQVPSKGDHFVHEHDAEIMLDPDEEPILPGFKDALVGAEQGADVEFELTVPADDEEYEQIAGRTVKFNVEVHAVEAVTLPALNDDFAVRVTEDEDEPLTLLQLRMRMRDALTEQLESNSKREYTYQVLDQMVKDADIQYPELMVEEQINDMIENLGQRMQQQGINLETYYSVTNTTEEILREQYREQAIENLRRSLVLREVVQQNELVASDEQIEARINDVASQFGGNAESFRSVFDTPRMRTAMINDITSENAFEYVGRIGRGEALDDFMQEMTAEAQNRLDEAEASRAEANAALEEVSEAVETEEGTVDDEAASEVQDQEVMVETTAVEEDDTND